MVRVTCWKEPDGRTTRLHVAGHAGAGDYGQDLVCAAVSALVETLALGLKSFGGIEVLKVEDGAANFVMGSNSRPEADVAVQVIGAGLKDLALSHARFVAWQELPSA